jgi:hypothetical protein
MMAKWNSKLLPNKIHKNTIDLRKKLQTWKIGKNIYNGARALKNYKETKRSMGKNR